MFRALPDKVRTIGGCDLVRSRPACRARSGERGGPAARRAKTATQPPTDWPRQPGSTPAGPHGRRGALHPRSGAEGTHGSEKGGFGGEGELWREAGRGAYPLTRNGGRQSTHPAEHGNRHSHNYGWFRTARFLLSLNRTAARGIARGARSLGEEEFQHRAASQVRLYVS